MSNKIIEISAQNATFKSIDNNIYNITFDPPIENGNILSFKQGYLDLRQLGNSANDSFILNNDVNCILTISYYEQFLSNNTDDNATRINLVDGTSAVDSTDINFFGRHFVLCLFTYGNNQQFNTPRASSTDFFDSVSVIKNEVNFKVPAGTYTSDSIVEYINDNIQNYNFGTELYSSRGINFPFTYTNTYIRYSDLALKFVDKRNDDYFKFLGFCRINDKGPVMNSFDPEFFAYYYEQDVDKPSTMASLMIGTPEINLQNINNKLSFEYLHNPIYDITASPNKTKTEVFYIQSIGTDNTQDLWYGLRRGGVNLIDFEPSSFWIDLLGFNNNNLIQIATKKILVKTQFEMDVDEFTTTNFINSTTQPFIGLSDLDFFLNNDTISNRTNFDPRLPSIKDGTLPVTQIVNSTIPVSAPNVINFADVSSGGHYQLQIETGFKVNNYQDAKTKKNICAIMSREYLNNGYLSVFDGGAQISIPENTSLTTITLSIIDPITKRLALNLGANNSFYFEVD